MPAPADNTLYQISLTPEQNRMFEEMKSQDLRNNSDMIRFLIVQEWNRRRQFAMPGFTVQGGYVVNSTK